MALKDLLVHVDQSEHALRRVRLAADLARRHGSRLTAIYVRELDAAQLHDERVAELGLGSPAAIARTTERIEKSMHDAADRLRAALEAVRRDDALEVEWRSLDGIGSILVPQQARFADLCILSQRGRRHAAIGYTFSEAVLFVRTPGDIRSSQQIVRHPRTPDPRRLEFQPRICASRERCAAVGRARRTSERGGHRSGQYVERYRACHPSRSSNIWRTIIPASKAFVSRAFRGARSPKRAG